MSWVSIDYILILNSVCMVSTVLVNKVSFSSTVFLNRLFRFLISVVYFLSSWARFSFTSWSCCSTCSFSLNAFSWCSDSSLFVSSYNFEYFLWASSSLLSSPFNLLILFSKVAILFCKLYLLSFVSFLYYSNCWFSKYNLSSYSPVSFAIFSSYFFIISLFFSLLSFVILLFSSSNYLLSVSACSSWIFFSSSITLLSSCWCSLLIYLIFTL